MKKREPHRTSDRTFQLWGWTFFIISALLFMVTTYRAGDWIGFLGGLFFLLANIVFLIPLVRQ